MLGTHSELCRGQMSHICDISPLRVKEVTSFPGLGKLMGVARNTTRARALQEERKKAAT